MNSSFVLDSNIYGGTQENGQAIKIESVFPKGADNVTKNGKALLVKIRETCGKEI